MICLIKMFYSIIMSWSHQGGIYITSLVSSLVSGIFIKARTFPMEMSERMLDVINLQDMVLVAWEQSMTWVYRLGIGLNVKVGK